MALYAFDGTSREDDIEDSRDTNVVRFARAYRGRRVYLSLANSEFAVIIYASRTNCRNPSIFRFSNAATKLKPGDSNPTMRRVNWSITTRTQRVRKVADSHRKRSRLQRLSFM